MKISIVSDLHLEFSGVELKNTQCADVLVLAGDITVAEYLHDYPSCTVVTEESGQKAIVAGRTRAFFETVSREFKHVVYVAGNHEFYNGKWYAALDYLREECAKYPNFHFLEEDSVEIDGVVFIGSTLWTNLNAGDPKTVHAVQDLMNDYRVIRNDRLEYRRLRPHETMARHHSAVDYIKCVVGNIRASAFPKRKVVVVGHHLPTSKSVNPRYSAQYLMNGAYYSDLSDVILDRPEIALWACGHTHHPHWYYVGDTLVACNPRGYVEGVECGYDEQTGWDPQFVVDLDDMPDPAVVKATYNRAKGV
jgi:predicted phosphodiesterase